MELNRELLVLSLMASVIIGCHGQFRIVGLLNDHEGIEMADGHQTNAQPRAFNEVDVIPKESSADQNLIKVHVMDQDNIASVAPPIEEVKNLEAVAVTTELSKTPDSTAVPAPAEPSEATTVEVIPALPNEQFAPEKQSRKYRPHMSRLRKLKLDGSNNNLLFYRDHVDRAPIFNSGTDWKFHKIAKYRNRYKSKCRCSSITNCPKLQITVPRCEPNQFLCCF